MKRHRKCDTTKYKNRRKREKVGHQRRMRVAEAQNRIRRGIIADAREAAERAEMERRRCGEALVNVLTRRLYALSPEHASEARVRQLFQIFKVFSRDPDMKEVFDAIIPTDERR